MLSQFKPLEQLMGVFPAGSKKFLPTTWQTLMFEADSPIIDFYPTDFKIDLNGKKYAWQGRCAGIESVWYDVTQCVHLLCRRGSAAVRRRASSACGAARRLPEPERRRE